MKWFLIGFAVGVLNVALPLILHRFVLDKYRF